MLFNLLAKARKILVMVKKKRKNAMLTQPSTHNLLSERFLQQYNNSTLSIPLLLSEDTHYSNDRKSENISENIHIQ